MTKQPSEPFVIGTHTWPGVAKLIEECGELTQILGKLLAYPDAQHPDGTNLIDRLHDEIADISAAIEFLISANGNTLDEGRILRRARTKLDQFKDWHAQGLAR